MNNGGADTVASRLARLVVAFVGAVVVLVGLAGGLVRPAAADGPSDDTPVVEVSWRTPGTPEPDGKPVYLDTSLWTADQKTPQPTIVLAHGFGGSKDDAAHIAAQLAQHGYTVISYTARGFGASGGLIHLGNPDYEGRDAVRIISAAAKRPEVAKVDGDPVIGFAGGSYGGAAALMAAGLDKRVDGVVSAFTWHSLKQALIPQSAVTGMPQSLADITPNDVAGVLKQRWAGLLFLSGLDQQAGRSGNTGSTALCGRFAPEICQEYLRTALTGQPSAGLLKVLDQSSMDRVLPDVHAPTLFVQGLDDTLFTLDQADANFRGLPAATPAAMSWVGGGHDTGIDLDTLLPPLEEWFDRYLKQDQAVQLPPEFSTILPSTTLVGSSRRGDQDQTEPTDERTITAASYPGREQRAGNPDGFNTGLVLAARPLAGGRQQVVSPPGGVPAALTSMPGGSATAAAVAASIGYQLAVLPGQSAAFTSESLTEPLTLLGSGRVRLKVTSSTTNATLFVGLWDIGPELPSPTATPTPPAGANQRSVPQAPAQPKVTAQPQTAILPQSLVAPVHLTGLTPDRPSTVEVALPAIVHQVPVGHRLRVVVSSTDQSYANRAAGAVYHVELASPDVMLPQLPSGQVTPPPLDVSLVLVSAVGLLTLGAMIGAWLLVRRERSGTVRDELQNVPLAVDDLVKTYPGGLRAVDGVTFRAEPGQVVGLLGPNGAGKTTVLRMLVGLIRPDSGLVFINGESVAEGAQALRGVGAFIEGPGLLPHLTGRQNLEGYWAVTGRPTQEAELDQALAVAALGTAIDRKVRGYSQGMRQRLGIAQAMLGRPPLLLLDEPSNGLDPPQITALRQVLRDYAATGRTVVVSSHLLSEVEQTCTHVVMMSGGRVVLAGSVPELTRDHTVSLEQVFLDRLAQPAAGADAEDSGGAG